MDYIFYADCHGLQSLVELDTQIFCPLKMTCLSNPQRFCVFGTITLEEDIFKSLNVLLETKQGQKEALELIKKAQYNLPVEMKNQFIKNMSKIPNDELDPFW